MDKWKCVRCKVSFPYRDIDKIRKHIATKRHKYLKDACPRCSSVRMVNLEGCYDPDGIRHGKKCLRCKTEYASYAHGLGELERQDYEGELPKWMIEKEEKEFHEAAIRRGYVKATN